MPQMFINFAKVAKFRQIWLHCLQISIVKALVGVSPIYRRKA